MKKILLTVGVIAVWSVGRCWWDASGIKIITTTGGFLIQSKAGGLMDVVMLLRGDKVKKRRWKGKSSGGQA